MLGAAILAASPAARAAEGWDPFGQLDATPAPKKRTAVVPAPAEPARPPLAAMDNRLLLPGSNTVANPPETPAGGYAPNQPLPQAVDEKSRGVERGELAPVVTSDGSGLPYELWQGLDWAGLEDLMARIEIPPRSPAVHKLWRRLITASVTPPGGAAGDARFDALRAEALYRSGFLEEANAAVNKDPGALSSNPALAVLAARIAIGQDQTEAACGLAKGFIAKRADLPKQLQGEALLLKIGRAHV